MSDMVFRQAQREWEEEPEVPEEPPREERCDLCDEPTGRAGKGDDSLYFGKLGPLCQQCRDELGNAEWDDATSANV